MRRTVLPWIFLFFAPGLWAQSSSVISGTVVDSSQSVLPLATVRLVDKTGTEVRQELTNSEGRFRFEGLAAGSYQVEASLTGFRSTTVATGTGSESRILLEVAPVREYINVTADRTEMPASLTGASTTVLDGRAIADRGQLLASSTLQSVPGVVVARSGGLGTVTSVFVRGGESDYNKILLDGIPLNEPGGTFEFANFGEEDLDRIEVVRGPQSALFGSDAMASTIQFFTHRGNPEDVRPRVSLGFEGGKFQTLHGRAGLSGGYKSFDYALGWSHLETDNQEPNNAFHNSTLSGNFGLGLGKNTTVRLIVRGDSGKVGTPGQTAFERPDSDAFFRKADGYAGFSVQNSTSSRWNQKLTYTFARTRQVSRDLFIDPPYTPTFEGHTAPFQFTDFPFDFLNDARREHLAYQSDVTLGNLGQPLGEHVVTFAFDWDRESAFIDDRLNSPTLPTLASRNNFGGVFQDQAIWGRFVLTNGFRVEDNGSFGKTVVPRSSASYLIRQSVGGFFGAMRLKANFGLGFKEPTFIQSFSPDPFFPGNPFLRPERSRSFDYGIEQRLWNERAKLELNGFDNLYRDIIASQSTGLFSGTYFNIAQSRADGAEAVIEIAPRNGLRIGLNYTFLQGVIERSSRPASPVFRQGQQLFRRPKHSGSAFLAADWRRFTLTSNVIFVGRRVDGDFSSLAPPITSDPSYTKWDIGWDFRAPRHVTYFGIFENVLNEHYMEALGFPALSASYRAGARVSF
ncbi:MAG TPA: TonB-dependent receptor plug domain-containing protein [Terriglobales bacterium]|nr:TonB-dependent receptor plug domain-containing protein [Terriglobales bacterium]